MTLGEILERFELDSRTGKINSVLGGALPSRLQLRGLSGSSPAFVASAVAKSSSQSHLFILPDKELAAYFFNDLESLLGELREDGETITHLPAAAQAELRQAGIPVLFFPSSYRRPYQVEETDNANVLLRAEVLDRLRREKRVLVVTYPSALSEMVVTRQLLEKNTLRLHRGEKVSIAFITDLLHSYAFERVDYVYEAGQYAVRGGIVDVFSFAHENPYRLEFFGDEVDSIRTFDALTQLSLKTIEHLTIIPNVQGKLLSENRESFLEYFSTAKHAVNPATRFSPSGSLEGRELRDSPHTIWLYDLEASEGNIQKEYETAVTIYEEQVKDAAITRLPPDQQYISGADFRRQVMNFSVVEFGNRFLLKDSEELDYGISPQPSFQKNFDLLTQALSKNTVGGYTNVIFTDSAKQSERLFKIFEDIGRKLDYHPLVVSIHEGFTDHALKLSCFTDHQIFERYHRFRLRDGFQRKKEAMSLKELRGLSPGDYVVHIDHGVGRFGGLEKIEVSGKLQEAIRLVYRDNDIVYVSIHSLHRISKFAGKDGEVPRIDKIGSLAWQNLKAKTKIRVREIAFDLIKLYAQRKAQKGFQFSPDNYLQHELEASFIYEDTPDQLKATQDVKRDMEREMPMDRLVCGDVGFGKTEVAIRAAFKAVCDSKQVAILVPTTILALQHFKTFSERLKDLPATVDYVNRFKTAAQKKETLARLQRGEIDIIIGTHALVGKDVKFKDLGLLIVDEEQKFGVAAKDKLKTLRTEVDTLTLTATPIPRTLQFSLMSARDLSIINTPPPNRFPVQTELHTFSEELVRDAVMFEMQRGGQVFFVHNKISTIRETAGMISRLVPDARVAIGHGQMEAHKLEEVMVDFIEGQFDVLVSTTIIESGIDVTNANTMIINDAQNFGLSDLHQMRGRVGRSNRKAFCYLIAPPAFMLTGEAQRRLKAVEEFSDLGAGFHIALRDLDIRGAGNLLGGEQSGFIGDIGFDMYQKILDEAIQELKETEFRDLFAQEEQEQKEGRKDVHTRHRGIFVRDTQIDTDMEILIPDAYIENITERLSLYRQLDDSKSEDDLNRFEAMLRDRFGAIPAQVEELIDTVRLRWLAMAIGFERLVLKNKRMSGYFIPKQDSPYYQSEAFTKVLQYVQANRQVKMKENNQKLTLTFEGITSIKDAMRTLAPIA